MNTPGTTLEHLQLILQAALAEPIGLVLRTNDRERARQRLYAARVKLADPAFATLQIRISPFTDGDLVICKETVRPNAESKELVEL